MLIKKLCRKQYAAHTIERIKYFISYLKRFNYDIFNLCVLIDPNSASGKKYLRRINKLRKRKLLSRRLISLWLPSSTAYYYVNRFTPKIEIDYWGRTFLRFFKSNFRGLRFLISGLLLFFLLDPLLGFFFFHGFCRFLFT